MIHVGHAPEPQKQRMKRLRLDIPAKLHQRIKGKAVMEGVTMVDMLRDLLEETYVWLTDSNTYYDFRTLPIHV